MTTVAETLGFLFALGPFICWIGLACHERWGSK